MSPITPITHDVIAFVATGDVRKLESVDARPGRQLWAGATRLPGAVWQHRSAVVEHLSLGHLMIMIVAFMSISLNDGGDDMLWAR